MNNEQPARSAPEAKPKGNTPMTHPTRPDYVIAKLGQADDDNPIEISTEGVRSLLAYIRHLESPTQAEAVKADPGAIRASLVEIILTETGAHQHEAEKAAGRIISLPAALPTGADPDSGEKFPICQHCTTEDLTIRHIAPVTNCPRAPHTPSGALDLEAEVATMAKKFQNATDERGRGIHDAAFEIQCKIHARRLRSLPPESSPVPVEPRTQEGGV